MWQNDGLPEQICSKCVSKLHISFQFKKLCEKSDIKLRQCLRQTEMFYSSTEEDIQVNINNINYFHFNMTFF